MIGVEHEPDEEDADAVLWVLCLHDVRLRVVVVVPRVGHGSHGGEALGAAHGPAERAALRRGCAGARHQPRAPPDSHHRTRRSDSPGNTDERGPGVFFFIAISLSPVFLPYYY